MKILEKVGMERTYLEEEGFKREDLVEDIMNYRLTRQMWENTIEL